MKHSKKSSRYFIVSSALATILMFQLSACGTIKRAATSYWEWGEETGAKMPVYSGVERCEGQLFCFGSKKNTPPPQEVTPQYPPQTPPPQAYLPPQPAMPPSAYAPRPSNIAAPNAPQYYQQPPQNAYIMPENAPTFATSPLQFDNEGRPIVPYKPTEEIFPDNMPPMSPAAPPIHSAHKPATPSHAPQGNLKPIEEQAPWLIEQQKEIGHTPIDDLMRQLNW